MLVASAKAVAWCGAGSDPIAECSGYRVICGGWHDATVWLAVARVADCANPPSQNRLTGHFTPMSRFWLGRRRVSWCACNNVLYEIQLVAQAILVIHHPDFFAKTFSMLIDLGRPR